MPPPNKYLINEAKFNKAKISTTVTKSGASQMQTEWIEFDLYKIFDDIDLIVDIKKSNVGPIHHFSNAACTKININTNNSKFDQIIALYNIFFFLFKKGSIILLIFFTTTYDKSGTLSS